MTLPCLRIAAVKALALTLVIALEAPPVYSQDTKQCSEKPLTEYKTHIGQRYSQSIVLKADGQLSILHIGDPGKTRYFRLRIEKASNSPKNWSLSLYGEQSVHPLQIIGPADFGQSKSFVWSRRISGWKGRAFLRTFDKDPGRFLKITSSIAVPKIPHGVYYSVADPMKPKWQYLLCPQDQPNCDAPNDDSPRWGESVGMLMMESNQKVWTCSGFLLAPDLFITNWHCGGIEGATPEQAFWDGDMLRSALIDFSWDGDLLSNEYSYSGKKVIAGKDVVQNRDLDYAIFRVRPLLQHIGQPPTVRLGLDVTPGANQSLNIIHHPLGEIKHLTQQKCAVVAVDHPSWFKQTASIDFGHSCDTEGGSSGSPVFDSSWAVVGIHHSGYSKLANGSCDVMNKAVKIQRILNDLHPDLQKEIKSWQ